MGADSLYYIDCDALAETCEANLAEIEDIMNVKGEDVAIKEQITDNEPVQICEVEPVQDMVG